MSIIIVVHCGKYSHNMEITVFWDIAPCSLVVDRRFRSSCCRDCGGSKHLWNVGMLQRDYTALYPWRLLSSYSPPRKPEISHLHSSFGKLEIKPVYRNWNMKKPLQLPPCPAARHTQQGWSKKPRTLTGRGAWRHSTVRDGKLMLCGLQSAEVVCDTAGSWTDRLTDTALL
jgi:hypothetical protein